MKTLKKFSRLDNQFGYVIVKREYQCQILKELKFNFVLIKIEGKTFKTDRNNLM
jgi:hypothetical protein